MANKLVLNMDGLVLKEITLTKERMTIGRRPHNDIQIDNLAISGEHARVVTILNDSFLEDLNSTNGTLVNGHPIKKHVLKDGDVVELGKYKLKYIVDPLSPEAAEQEKARAARAAAAKTMQDKQAVAAAQASESASSAQAESSEPLPIGAIQILNGVNADRTIDLTKTLTTLGKPGIQVAVIARRQQGYFITHVEGVDFPIVNGQVLDASAQPITDGDEIEVAGIKMKFALKK